MYKDISEAVKKHPEVDVLVNFASLRSAYDATIEALSLNHVCSNCFDTVCIVLYSVLILLNARHSDVLFILCFCVGTVQIWCVGLGFFSSLPTTSVLYACTCVYTRIFVLFVQFHSCTTHTYT